MRLFALTTLSVGAALNFWLGWGGQRLAENLRARLQTYGAKLPAVVELALALPPWFYLLCAVAILSAALGLRRVIATHVMLYAAVAILVLDILLLAASQFALGYLALRL